MAECRYYDLCCFTDDSCNWQPECPKSDNCHVLDGSDIRVLTELADEMENLCGPWSDCGKYYAPLIRKALGE